MVARVRAWWREWRLRRRQYAIDRALYKLDRGASGGPADPVSGEAVSGSEVDGDG